MRRPLLSIAVLAAALVVGYFLWPRPATAPAPSPAAAPAPTPPSPSSPISNPKSQIPPSASASPTSPAPLEILDLARDLNAPAGSVAADLRLVSSVLETFRTNFPREGNPVGTNAEITAVLTGANRLRLAFLHPRHPALNASGELCDRWGTPYFFHAESAARMEIRSAGPDKKMWTADDEAFLP
jgi:hypothetical protein